MNRSTVGLALLLVVAATAIRADDEKLREAIVAQQSLVEETPEDAELYNDLGNLLTLVDRLEEAEEAYRMALQLDPELTAPRFNLGLLLHQTGRPAKAQREFERLLKIDPEHAWAHYQLGVLRARRGKRGVAIRSYARAVRLDPRLTDPAYNPHILDNMLAASATLLAYADLSSVDLVPRAYEAPRRIAGLLIPMLTPRGTIATEVSDPEGSARGDREIDRAETDGNAGAIEPPGSAERREKRKRATRKPKER